MAPVTRYLCLKIVTRLQANPYQWKTFEASPSVLLSRKFLRNAFWTAIKDFLKHQIANLALKKVISCSHAIFSVKCVVDEFVNNGSTINLCCLDLRKAFDKMNHHGLFIKLMDRMLPVNLLATLEYWFSICFTSVRWGDCYSNFISLKCGVRQGGVLSAYFFALYIDGIISVIHRSNFGCYIGAVPVNIFLYADDIILLAPSVNALQKMLTLCEHYLKYVDMALNANKSVCIRFGRCFKHECSQLISLNGEVLCWVDTCRYLGVYFVSSKKFKCSLSCNKRSFYRSFNCIFSKIGWRASEEILIRLLFSKCLPIFVYGLDACPLTKTHTRLLDFVVDRCFMKIFKTKSIDIVNICQCNFNVQKASSVALNRKRRFLYGCLKMIITILC